MQSAQVSSGEEMRFDSRPHRKQRPTRSSSFPDHLGALFLLLLYNEDSRIPNKASRRHLQNRDKATGRESETSARWFSPARKTSLFLGSLSSSRNHARSPPDGFLFKFPARFKIITVLEMLPSEKEALRSPPVGLFFSVPDFA